MHLQLHLTSPYLQRYDWRAQLDPRHHTFHLAVHTGHVSPKPGCWLLAKLLLSFSLRGCGSSSTPDAESGSPSPCATLIEREIPNVGQATRDSLPITVAWGTWRLTIDS